MGNIVDGRLIDENQVCQRPAIDDHPEYYISDRLIFVDRTNSYELAGKTHLEWPYDTATSRLT